MLNCEFNLKVNLVVLFAIIGTSIIYAEDQILEEFASKNAQFTAEVYEKLTKSNSGNIVVCPFSVATILALVHAGARGQTASQISSTLHLPGSPDEIEKIFTKLKIIYQDDNYFLSTANKIYVKNGVQINDQFKDTAVETFKSDIQNMDFSRKEEASAEINKWVESKTLNKIKDLIKPNDLDETPIAILINAMYFQANWTNSFREEYTRKMPFYVNSRKQAVVDTMDNTHFFSYYESDELNAKFLELPYGPYVGENASMMFILPNHQDGLSALETRMADILAMPNLETWDFVHVQMPKFKIENTIQFNSILQELGIVDAFEDSADFSEIFTSKTPLKVTKVLQKVFIEVHEKGTTATAASYLMPIPSSPPPPPKEFIANHPFIYFVRVKGVIIFAGRYTSPDV